MDQEERGTEEEERENQLRSKVLGKQGLRPARCLL